MTRCNPCLARLVLGLSLAAGLAAATSTATAQTHAGMQARIPFAFSANNQPLTPGDYIVEITQDRFLSFRNVATGKVQTVLIRPDDWQANKGSSRLTFRREAGLTYLTQVWDNGRDLHGELLSHPRPQRELAKLAPPPSTFEIAMK